MKRKSALRTALVLLLAAQLLASSCSEHQAGMDDGTAADTSAETETLSLEERYPIPEANYEDASFDMLVWRSGYWGQDYNDLWVEADSADPIDAAVFERNTRGRKSLASS